MQRIDGPCLSLRLVQPEDAAYIHGLRMDTSYNSHLSVVAGTIEDQRGWIEAYKAREAAGTEYYYVIERKDAVRCGVVRLYEITKNQFTWGSWILDKNKPLKAALESASLSFGIAFDSLGLTLGHIDVRKDNRHAIAFYQRFGMHQVQEDAHNIYYEYTREQFAANKLEHMAAITGTVNASL